MKKTITSLFSILFASILLTSCDLPLQNAEHVSKSGVQEAKAQVNTDINGLTIEQNNISKRLQEDNKAGAIKHLYLISAYSGQVIMYSTVKGKVTSSGKRLSPTQIAKTGYQYGEDYNPDLIQDDGTYGSSVEYVYWWDSKDVYHQQYVTGGMILHISNEPIAVKNITINFELSKEEN